MEENGKDRGTKMSTREEGKRRMRLGRSFDQSRRPRPICTPIYTLEIRRYMSLIPFPYRPSFNPLLFHTPGSTGFIRAHRVLEFGIG